MTTTTDAIETIAETVFPEPDDDRGGTPQRDPKLHDLVWALSLGAGRMPLFP